MAIKHAPNLCSILHKLAVHVNRSLKLKIPSVQTTTSFILPDSQHSLGLILPFSSKVWAWWYAYFSLANQSRSGINWYPQLQNQICWYEQKLWNPFFYFLCHFLVMLCTEFSEMFLECTSVSSVPKHFFFFYSYYRLWKIMLSCLFPHKIIYQKL